MEGGGLIIESLIKVNKDMNILNNVRFINNKSYRNGGALNL